MNIVLGVDGKRSGETPPLAISMLRRLRFPSAEIDVVHVLAPMPFEDLGLEIGIPSAAFWSERRATQESAQALIGHIAAKLWENPSPTVPEAAMAQSQVHVSVMNAPSIIGGLLQQADKQDTDLIAVDGSHVGSIGAFLTGSVARALVISSHKHSLLLVKDWRHARDTQRLPTPKVGSEIDGLAGAGGPDGAGSPIQDRPIRAVFATDHSFYANRCLKELIRLAPGGISHLTVLTACPEQDLTPVERWLPKLAIHPATVLRQALVTDNEADLRKLAPWLTSIHATSESQVIGAPIDEAIAKAMEATNADLLILGAQAHGIVDRLMLGSVSFRQAMTAPYSILILRA